MSLDFDDTVARLKRTLPRLRDGGVALKITWVRAPGIRSSDEEFARFCAEQFPGVTVDMENTAENRAGNLTIRGIEDGLSFFPPVDFTKEIWCSYTYFNDFVCWNGDAIMCAPDFFGRHMQLGNIVTDTPRRADGEKARGHSHAPVPVAL